MRRLIAGTINYRPAEPGWENVHVDISERAIWDSDRGPVPPDLVMDVAEMWHFSDETFDEVRMWHVLEHLPRERATMAAAETFRILKPGGTFDIEVPDIDRVCHAWCDGELDLPALNQWLYGEQLAQHEPGDSHRFGYDERELRRLLEQAGFEVGGRVETGLACRFLAVKPA